MKIKRPIAGKYKVGQIGHFSANPDIAVRVVSPWSFCPMGRAFGIEVVTIHNGHRHWVKDGDIVVDSVPLVEGNDK